MQEPLHAIRFPSETDEYRQARNELLQAEIELRRQLEAVAAQRRRLPLGGQVPTDYSFEECASGTDSTRTVRLSDLFENGKDSLVLYSFMYGPAMEAACPSCTSIIDALDGEAPHIMQRVNLAIVAKSPIQRFREHARARGWRNLRLLSSANDLQPRLPRRGAGRQPEPDRDRVRPPRRQASPLLQHRAFLHPHRPRTEHATCRPHLASLEHPRPHPRRPRQRLVPATRVQLGRRVSARGDLAWDGAG